MRIAGAILIVFAASAAGYAQQFEQPPLMPPRRDLSPRQLFPSEPLDSQVWPRIPPRRELPADRFLPPASSGAPLAALLNEAREQPFPSARSGSVCLRSVPVDPSIDPRFVIPRPDDARSLPTRIIEITPCVTLAPQQPR